MSVAYLPVSQQRPYRDKCLARGKGSSGWVQSGLIPRLFSSSAINRVTSSSGRIPILLWSGQLPKCLALRTLSVDLLAFSSFFVTDPAMGNDFDDLASDDFGALTQPTEIAYPGAKRRRQKIPFPCHLSAASGEVNCCPD